MIVVYQVQRFRFATAGCPYNSGGTSKSGLSTLLQRRSLQAHPEEYSRALAYLFYSAPTRHLNNPPVVRKLV